MILTRNGKIVLAVIGAVMLAWTVFSLVAMSVGGGVGHLRIVSITPQQAHNSKGKRVIVIPPGSHKHFKPGVLHHGAVLGCDGVIRARLPGAGQTIHGFTEPSSPSAASKGSTHIAVARHKDGSVTVRCD